MNLEHLAADVPTVFERLDDADIRTAGTTYLMYRGRHRHEVSGDTALTRIASTVFRHAVYGPREFFYADLFASRRTPLPLAARPAGGARPARGLRRRVPDRARPVRLPALLAAGQRHALAQERADGAGRVAGHRRPPDRAPVPRRRRRRRLPRGARGDRAVGPLAVARGGGDRPVQGLRGLRRAAGHARRRRATPRPRSRCARTRARPRSTCSTATAAPSSCRGSSARCSTSRASTS